MDSAGRLGEYYSDFGRGADAITRYVAGMAELPQLTPPGEVFAYNNAAVVLTGHVIERIAGQRTKTSCARGCWTR